MDQVYETKLGTVRVAEECGVTGRSSEKRVAKLREFIDRALKKEMGKPPFVPDMLFGTGGTFTALASIIMAAQGQAGQPMWGFRVTRAADSASGGGPGADVAGEAVQGGGAESAAGRHYCGGVGDH